MGLTTYRLGDRRTPREGLRLGTVRHLPRGVKKADYAKRDFFDLWLPDLAPSKELVAWMFAKPVTAARWKVFTRRYYGELAKPPARRLVALVAEMSKRTDVAVGCYCEDESRCHRSLLYQAIRTAGTLK